MVDADTVTIPRQEYEAMKERLARLEDIVAGHAAVTGATLPHDFAMRIIGGDHPARVWREYRGMHPLELAIAAGMSEDDLRDIEIGKKPGSVQAYKGMAVALGVPVDALLP